MYAGRAYETSVATSQEARFACVHCNFECDAMVTGVGKGSGHSPLFLDNAGAADRAKRQAVGDARANMHFALHGATCPKCGKHDASVRRTVYASAAVQGVGIAALVGLVVIAACKGSTLGWIAGSATIAVVGAILTFARAHRMLSGAILLPPR